MLKGHRAACREAIVRRLGASNSDASAANRNGSVCLARLIGMFGTESNMVGCSCRGVVSVTWCGGGRFELVRKVGRFSLVQRFLSSPETNDPGVGHHRTAAVGDHSEWRPPRVGT